MSTFIPTGVVTAIVATTDLGNVVTVTANVQSMGSDTVMIDSDFSSNVCVVGIATIGAGNPDYVVLLPGQSKIITNDNRSRVPSMQTITVTTLKGSATVYVAPGQVSI